MAAPSSLSIAARALRTHLAGAVGLPESQILIGHPNMAVKDIDGEATKQFLNLFFYRVDHGAYPADGAANEPQFLRLYCLITALGAKETVGTSTVSAGENDLRLVGGVMQRLHGEPILALQNEADEEVAQLQIIMHALTLDDINHIWSTQGDTVYRLSVGYELALVPMPLEIPAARGPRVGAIGLDVQSGLDFRALSGEGFDISGVAPQVPAITVATAHPDWVPHVILLAADNTLQYAVTFGATALPPTLRAIALGQPGAVMQLHWETLDPAAPNPSWQNAVAAPDHVTLDVDTIDPRQSTASLLALALDVALPLAAPGQAVLYATRDYTRPDGVVVTIRSNPLLVSVHGGAP